MPTLQAKYPLTKRLLSKEWIPVRLWACAAERLAQASQENPVPVFDRDVDTPVPGASARLTATKAGFDIEIHLPPGYQYLRAVKSVSPLIAAEDAEGAFRDEAMGPPEDRYQVAVLHATRCQLVGVTLFFEPLEFLPVPTILD